MRNLLILSLLFTFISCASKEKQLSNPFDALTLKKSLVKGKSTQKDVLSKFGGPNIVSEENGEDIWVYSRNSSNSSGSSLGTSVWGLLPIPLIAGVDTSFSNDSIRSKSISLTLEFYKNKILKNYKIVKTSF